MAKEKKEVLALVDKSYVVEMEPSAWERQNYESHFWFEVFRRHYLSKGLTRTLRKAFQSFLLEKFNRELSPEEAGNIPKMWYDAYAQWNWEDRAVLYDEDVSYQRNLIWAERQSELREKEWVVAGKLLGLANDTLTAWMERFAESMERRGKFPELRFVDIERAVNLASRVGRLSAGLATENTNVTAELTVKARNIESVRKKRWAELETSLGDLDNDPTIIEGELVDGD